VASEAIRMARASADTAPGPRPDVASRMAHVGYYLIDRGRRAREVRVAMRGSFSRALRRFGSRRSLFLYVLGIGVVTAGATVAFLEGLLDLSRWRAVPLAWWFALAAPLA